MKNQGTSLFRLKLRRPASKILGIRKGFENPSFFIFQTKPRNGGLSYSRPIKLKERIRPENTIETVEHKFNQDIQRRLGCVLKRVSDSVTYDSRFVAIRSFPDMVPGLNILLSVIPCSAGVRHKYGHRKPVTDTPPSSPTTPLAPRINPVTIGTIMAKSAGQPFHAKRLSCKGRHMRHSRVLPFFP